MDTTEERVCKWQLTISGWYVPQCQGNYSFTERVSWWIYCPFCGGKIVTEPVLVNQVYTYWK